jgi:hypothetical protein
MGEKTEGINEQKTEKLWRKYMRNECSLVELLREIPDEGYRNGYIEYCEINHLKTDEEENAKAFVEWYESTDNADLLQNWKGEEHKSEEQETQQEDNWLVEKIRNELKKPNWIEGLTSENAIKITKWRLENPAGSKKKCQKELHVGNNVVYDWWSAANIIPAVFNHPHTHLRIITEETVKETLTKLQEKLKK